MFIYDFSTARLVFVVLQVLEGGRWALDDLINCLPPQLDAADAKNVREYVLRRREALLDPFLARMHAEREAAAAFCAGCSDALVQLLAEAGAGGAGPNSLLLRLRQHCGSDERV